MTIEAVNESKQPKAGGVYAVLGMDIVSFSTLDTADQIEVIDNLHQWITLALGFNKISENEYIWSPAGDGGYLTFTSVQACRSAVDVAFAICEKTKYKLRGRERFQIRFGLHSGQIQEDKDFRGNNNVWGIGINVTSRIVSISAPSQLLVSKQYVDNFIDMHRQESDLTLGKKFCRTMKHGQEIEVMNINRGDVCLNTDEANALRWQCIGGLWQKVIQEYKFLIQDSMLSNDPIAALAAGKFLLDLGQDKPVVNLCHVISQSGDPKVTKDTKYPKTYHSLFNKMSPDKIQAILQSSSPLFFKQGDIICKEGEDADSCFFPVSGTIFVDLPEPINIGEGEIIGEFNLWIPEIKRTATLKAHDEGLCLKIKTEAFKLIVPDNSDVAKEVFSIIKNRIIDNIIGLKRFFFFISPDAKQDLKQCLRCEKYPSGITLDLDKDVYIIFHGKVEIEPQLGLFDIPPEFKLEISVQGHYGSEEAVGIKIGRAHV